MTLAPFAAKLDSKAGIVRESPSEPTFRTGPITNDTPKSSLASPSRAPSSPVAP